MIWVDYFIIGTIVVSALVSLLRGFVREALSLAIWILAFWVAWTFFRDLAPVFGNWVSTPSVQFGIGLRALGLDALRAVRHRLRPAADRHPAGRRHRQLPRRAHDRRDRTQRHLPPDDGPGGPILIIADITHSANPHGRYYAEILRNEGLNEFTLTDISLISPARLAAYDVVVLAEMDLTAGQVSMFIDWVNAGGNLIAMRPDKQLAGFLGLIDLSASMSNAYLLVSDTPGPGSGIVHQTIQYHGSADLYSLNGASSLATIYANANTPTNYRAVTLRSVGGNVGQLAAFSYDLSRSVILTRQRRGGPPRGLDSAESSTAAHRTAPAG